MTNRITEGFDCGGMVAVVTGAARGIGAASSALLAQAGATVVLTDVLADQVEATAAAIRAAGGSAEGVVLDVADKAAVDRLADDVAARHGRLDGWVNCAAIIIDVDPIEITEEQLDRIFAVNFKGTVWGTQAAARHMLARGAGSIVNFTSGAVDMPTPTHVPYATTKAAVAQFSRSVAAAWGARGVRVNTVAPGWTDTPMNERHVLREDGSIDPERKAAYVATMSRIGVLGIPGHPDDQAFAVLFLIAPAGRFWTGQVMRPNGGATMPW
jgi:3-oxoacyl-[acyl-carrier protein] reductase